MFTGGSPAQSARDAVTSGFEDSERRAYDSLMETLSHRDVLAVPGHETVKQLVAEGHDLELAKQAAATARVAAMGERRDAAAVR